MTFRELISPLVGMILGPILGGSSIVLGNILDFALGKPVVFDFLDFVPDLVSATVAGLAFTRHRKAAIGLPVVLLLWFSLDPISPRLTTLGGIAIPFLWMHMVAIGSLAIAVLFEGRGRLDRITPAFVGAVTFASTMSGHAAGSILFENVIFRLDGVIPSGGYSAFWTLVFYAYPLERVFYTVFGTVAAYSVLRVLPWRSRQHPID